ncbi:ImmA/IrrE family metallo-endopeptidase [Romboutsia sp. 1001216sp1]|uniref:ImmA/IrrE family metallo-endopeptidase n=1 Tax=unclassified Romboutsia TaxID=2626894 RepID=UPI0018AC3D58|nr:MULTISPECIES: ImmA/IrrE family metallo-endopeptidase [unclassified Romboutsia]MDB8792593.1 ImmA/IrrE family metallo-endopeptidase [Romboutsia sp. 1001216sp1]MDB8796240.1 ImmA/IrrE family metallo-endopeptidase [Romboutsia sp. 1001216sp1]MDB8798233.1 ImmA/IrrE family metallo-endopeptidase [Romboutsia sp. 1001216sp1]
MNAKYEAKKLINKYKTNNPFELMDYLDILYIRYPLKGNLRGYYTKEFGEKVICISSRLCDEEVNLVAAHELGHAILHEDKNILFISRNTLQSKDKLEKQANKFAAEILLDDNIFSEYYGYSLEEISKCECVSYELVEHKYNNLNK